MRLIRPFLGACTVGALLLTNHAGAATFAPKTFTMSDPAGDANALNGQGALGGGAGPVSADGNVTPAGSQADKDLTGVTFASTFTTKKYRGKTLATCTGLTATVNLSGAPGANSIYRITGSGTVNAGFFWVSYDGTKSLMQFIVDASSATGSSTKVPLINPAVVKGNSIVFTLTEADLKAAGESLNGFAWTGLGAEDRSVTPAATVPVWDEIANDTANAFKPC